MPLCARFILDHNPNGVVALLERPIDLKAGDLLPSAATAVPSAMRVPPPLLEAPESSLPGAGLIRGEGNTDLLPVRGRQSVWLLQRSPTVCS